MKENYQRRHREGTSNDDHPKNLDDGPLTSPGAHSIKGDAQRQALEILATQEAMQNSLLPPSWDAEKQLARVQRSEVKRVESSVRTKLYEKLHDKLDENLDKVSNAYDEYFQQISSDDTDKDTLAAKDHFRRNFINPEMLAQMEASRSKKLAEDNDFQQFRVYKRGHYYQQQMMMSKNTINAAMAGRRSGKTEGNQLNAASRFVVPDKRVLIICLTYETASQLYWHPILKMAEELDISIKEKEARSGNVLFSNGSIVRLTGNSTSDEREKLRGGKWDLVIIDEVQSQKALPYLIHDIIEPMLLDRKGQLWLTGTGPRIRGTMWEKIWSESKSAFRLNWNITHNPFIPDHEIVLQKIMKDKGINENDPLFIREYLGKIAYDDDALVIRLKSENFFTPDTLANFISSQPLADLRFIGGLDYGHSDHDAFCIVLYSESSPINWIVYQYKMNLEGIAELSAGIRTGLEYVKNHEIFSRIPLNAREDFFTFADSSDGRASSDLMLMLGINIFNAYKHDKSASLDFIQDDVRRGWLMVEKLEEDMTPFEDESLKTLFKRDEKDNLTREIDDDTYHPDMIPAVQFALRSGPWQFRVQER